MVMGSRVLETGAIIDLSKYPYGEYRLYINDQQRKIFGGQKNIIPLDFNKKYKIRLINENNSNIIVEDESKDVYLHRGNISFLKWNIFETKVVSARALLDGKPLANEIVRSDVSTSITDEKGQFLIDVNSNANTLQIGNNICNIGYIVGQYVFDDINCKINNLNNNNNNKED
jgi:hypothetical protein